MPTALTRHHAIQYATLLLLTLCWTAGHALAESPSAVTNDAVYNAISDDDTKSPDSQPDVTPEQPITPDPDATPDDPTSNMSPAELAQFQQFMQAACEVNEEARAVNRLLHANGSDGPIPPLVLDLGIDPAPVKPVVPPKKPDSATPGIDSQILQALQNAQYENREAEPEVINYLTNEPSEPYPIPPKPLVGVSSIQILDNAIQHLDLLEQSHLTNLVNSRSLGYRRTTVMTEMIDGFQLWQVAVQADFRTGEFHRTDRPTDVAIDGPGFFAIKTSDMAQVACTRRGDFRVLNDRQIGLLIDAKPWPLDPEICLPANAVDFKITLDGRVIAVCLTKEPQEGQEPEYEELIGQVMLCRFQSVQLTMPSTAVYIPGPKAVIQTGKPGQPGFGELITGQLELSNVDPQYEQEQIRELRRTRRMLERMRDKLAE